MKEPVKRLEEGCALKIPSQFVSFGELYTKRNEMTMR